MNSEMVEFAANGTQRFEAYVSRPASGSGPAVIVIQEWWGLVGHIKAVCDRFAEAGFVAMAPDLYGGVQAEEPEEAGKMLMALNIGETEKILARAGAKLLEDSAVSSSTVGVVGFCMGGQLALLAATTNPKVSAAVDFYGIHPNVQPDFTKLAGPVLGFFAEKDGYASPEVVNALDAKLTELGKAHTFKTYPGTDHAFFNDDRPEVYDAAAAKDAWETMTTFFRDHVK